MFKRLLKYLTITATLLGTLLFSLPFIVPLDEYRPLLQEQLSEVLGRDVLVGDLTPQFTPLPVLTASNVLFLGDKRSGELMAQQIEITIDPLELLNREVVIHSLHINGAGVNQPFIESLLDPPASKKNKAASDNTSPLAITQISGSNIMLRTHDQTRLGPFRFTLFFAEQSRFKELYVSRMDGSLNLNIKPNTAGTHDLRVTGRHWTLPTEPTLLFDKIQLEAVLHQGHAELTDVKIESYGGTLYTQGTLSWHNGWEYNGLLTTSAIQLAPPLAHFDIDTLDGYLHSDLKIRLRSNTLHKLFANPDLTGAFHIRKGVVSRSGSTHTLLNFDELSANGHLANATFTTDNMVLKCASGTIYGTTHLSWEKDWQVSGAVEGSEIDAERFLGGFIDNKVVSGTFFASTKFNLTGRNTDELLQSPSLTGDFKITNGTIYKADLEKASTNLSKEGSHGGETPFQNFIGKVKFESSHITLTDLDITSTSMTASGDVNINPQDELEGEIVVGLRKTASIISAPLKVSGTIDDPNLRLTNDAIIGGVIGTSVLGPGVGTAVGMKVGRIIKKIGSAFSTSGPAKADLIPEKK